MPVSMGVLATAPLGLMPSLDRTLGHTILC